MSKMIKIRDSGKDIPKMAKVLCDSMHLLTDFFRSATDSND